MYEPDDDLILDACLDEVVGGAAPPDVSAHVLRALGIPAGYKNGHAANGNGAAHPVPVLSARTEPAASTNPIVATPTVHVTGAARRARRRWSSHHLPWAVAGTASLLAAMALYALYRGDEPAGPVVNRPRPDAADGTIPRPAAPQRPATDHARPADDLVQVPPPVAPGPEPPVAPSSDQQPPDSDKLVAVPPTPPGPKVEPPDSHPRVTPAVVDDAEVIALINDSLRRRWQQAGVPSSSAATEAEWCRRVFLAIIGRIPSLEELAAHLADRAPDRRKKLVDRLLDSDEYLEQYARNWTSIWTATLIGRSGMSDDEGLTDRQGMQQYLRRAFYDNKPYDRMVRELVSATGSTRPGQQDFDGAANFLAANFDDKGVRATAVTAQVFLGMQLQCAQCHNHPFNDWKQHRFWELNAFFRQTRTLREFESGTSLVKNVRLADEDFRGEGDGDPAEAEIYFEQRNGLLKVAYPVFIDGTEVDRSGYLEDMNRRRALADLVARSDWTSRAVVNRIWAHFFGYGFTRPVDDMGPHNPPSHPELLDELARQFAAGGYDLKRLIRWITASEAYALSSRANSANEIDDPALGHQPLFSRYYARQMRAEQLYESLLVAAALDDPRGTYEQHAARKAQWLRQFAIAYDTDEGGEASLWGGTIPQTLMMMNGELISKATSVAEPGFLQQVVRDGAPNSRKIDKLFLAAVARQPSRDELRVANQLLASRGSAAEALEDVWWALLNSNEFILDH